MIDAHVHLREPGGLHKEGITSGTAAALAGGVVGLLDMPNNTPPTVDRAAWEAKQAAFEAKAVADYGLFLGYTGGSLEPLRELGPLAVGLKLYLDETFGDLTLNHEGLARVFDAWPGPGPIAIHAESPTISKALQVARETGRRLHVCHVPHPDDLLRIEAARQGGLQVTCEVTPHHLFLSTLDLPRLGPYGWMKPPLIGPEGVARFWELLDLVDMIASDHAPHTRAEKDGPAPPPGVPGLETTLLLLLDAVDRGRLTLERMLELVYWRPLAIYGLGPIPDTRVEIVWGEPAYRLPSRGYWTRCGWSPFAGRKVRGRVLAVRVRGREVWREGRLLARPGDGRPLRRVSQTDRRAQQEV
jgi:carbamoyl-phosphate synthase/aspartate carbamoyltransferase/dihydroorotase